MCTYVADDVSSMCIFIMVLPYWLFLQEPGLPIGHRERPSHGGDEWVYMEKDTQGEGLGWGP